MSTLGNLYFYVILIIIVVILFGVAIANSIYFSEVYQEGSDAISIQESQQLIITNIIIAVLLFVVILFLFYMIFTPFYKDDELHTMKETLNQEEQELKIKN